jgi:Fasciclin domain
MLITPRNAVFYRAPPVWKGVRPEFPVMIKQIAQRAGVLLGAATAGALTGLLATAAAIGLAQLVAGVTGSAGEPVIAVGSAAIDLTPVPVKDFAIRHFGSHDKMVLLAGIYVVLALFAMLTGILAGPAGLRAGRAGRFRGARRRGRGDQAGVRAGRRGPHARGADQILSTSADGWTCGTPIETVMDGRDALLAGGMVTLAKMGSTYTVNGAKVVCGGVTTANATVYIISSVLMPKS